LQPEICLYVCSDDRRSVTVAASQFRRKSLAVNCRDSGKRPAMRPCLGMSGICRRQTSLQARPAATCNRPLARRSSPTLADRAKPRTARVRAPRDRGCPRLACGLLRAAAGWLFTSPHSFTPT
jgi:hypothetical protein